MSIMICLQTRFIHGCARCKCSFSPPDSLSKFPAHIPKRYSSAESLKEAYCKTKQRFESEFLGNNYLRI